MNKRSLYIDICLKKIITIQKWNFIQLVNMDSEICLKKNKTIGLQKWNFIQLMNIDIEVCLKKIK